ncbi:hypothetical protein, partial [Pannonibacter indicus]|uniref:hypothetical protein n=1 Tax=Pannonibacter indicus TaxID=466044 RepID=UPI0035AFE232
PMMEKIVQTAKQAVKAMVLSASARFCAPPVTEGDVITGNSPGSGIYSRRDAEGRLPMTADHKLDLHQNTSQEGQNKRETKTINTCN